MPTCRTTTVSASAASCPPDGCHRSSPPRRRAFFIFSCRSPSIQDKQTWTLFSCCACGAAPCVSPGWPSYSPSQRLCYLIGRCAVSIAAPPVCAVRRSRICARRAGNPETNILFFLAGFFCCTRLPHTHTCTMHVLAGGRYRSKPPPFCCCQHDVGSLPYTPLELNRLPPLYAYSTGPPFPHHRAGSSSFVRSLLEDTTQSL